MLSRIISALRAVLRVVILSLPVLLLFAVTVVVIAATVAWFRHRPLTDSLYVGIVCGLIAWLIVAVFHIKRETSVVPCAHRKELLGKIKQRLHELGYHLRSETDEGLTFTPSFQALLFGGGIKVQVEGGNAKITGPRVYVERLRNHLRFQSQFERIQQSRADSINRLPSERGFRRVQISLRLTPEQMAVVPAAVIDLLKREGADAHCEVHIVAQNGQGIREQAVDGALRELLAQHGVSADIRKDPVQAPAAEQDTVSLGPTVKEAPSTTASSTGEPQP